mgnify:CR=1 FL=1
MESNPGGYIWPVSSRYITSTVGGRTSPGGIGSTNHKGTDIGRVGYTSSVYASKAGTVIVATYSKSYGNYVVISHGSGNTTLYALPKPEVVLRWREQTTDDFRFCFKFPATISHQAALRHCDDLVTEFLTRMSPLAPRIGQYWLQLPATFGPRELPALWHFLDSLPGEFNYGVEVRHPQFFAKGEEEQTLNRGLHQRGVNRVILDSRPVHAARPHSEAIRDAQRKKPKVPVHAVLTATNPLIRFIGSDDMTQNRELFQSGYKN